jgi:hypothetical protein
MLRRKAFYPDTATKTEGKIEITILFYLLPVPYHTNKITQDEGWLDNLHNATGFVILNITGNEPPP